MPCVILPVTKFHECTVWRRGGEWLSAGFAISACRAIDLMSKNVQALLWENHDKTWHHKHDLHQQLDCLWDLELASLAGTIDKKDCSIRLLANSPPILSSNYRGDAD